MHSARIENSDRLQRVYNRLLQGPATTLDIIRDTSVCAVSSIISELRANKIDINCECVRRGVYRYNLARLF